MTTTTEPALRRIPLDQLRESKYNPRSVYDPAELNEMKDSMLAVGILTPLTVRPVAAKASTPGHYEIAAGHQRFKAATLAGFVDLPCVVRDMSDEEFMLVINIENLQRTNLHPLDEARGFASMMKLLAFTPEAVAAKVGKTPREVRDTVRLLKLTKDAQKLFREGVIPRGHARLLATLDPKDQDRALASDGSDLSRIRGLFVPESVDHDPRLEFRDDDARPEPRKVVAYGEFERWVNGNVRFDIDAPDVAVLFPETHEVIGEAIKQNDTVVSITYEHFIPEEARDPKERTIGPRSWRRADGKFNAPTCERSVIGVVRVGPGRGDNFRVCLDKKNCAVHWGVEQKAAKQRAQENEKYADRHAQQRESEAARAASDKRQQEEIEAKRLAWKDARPLILAALGEKIRKMPPTTGFLAKLLVANLVEDHQVKDVNKLFARGKSADDFLRYLIFAMLYNSAMSYNAPSHFPDVAKEFGIDAEAILLAKMPKKVGPKDTTPAKGPAKKAAPKKKK